MPLDAAAARVHSGAAQAASRAHTLKGFAVEFFETLAGTLAGGVHGSAADTRKRNIAALSQTLLNSGIEVGAAVRKARKLLGQNNTEYLQTGISLIYAGEHAEQRDVNNTLYPSSLYGGSAEDARVVVVDSLTRSLLAQQFETVSNEVRDVQHRLDRCHVPIIAYALSIPELALASIDMLAIAEEKERSRDAASDGHQASLAAISKALDMALELVFEAGDKERAASALVAHGSAPGDGDQPTSMVSEMLWDAISKRSMNSRRAVAQRLVSEASDDERTSRAMVYLLSTLRSLFSFDRTLVGSQNCATVDVVCNDLAGKPSSFRPYYREGYPEAVLTDVSSVEPELVAQTLATYDELWNAQKADVSARGDGVDGLKKYDEAWYIDSDAANGQFKIEATVTSPPTLPPRAEWRRNRASSPFFPFASAPPTGASDPDAPSRVRLMCNVHSFVARRLCCRPTILHSTANDRLDGIFQLPVLQEHERTDLVDQSAPTSLSRHSGRDGAAHGSGAESAHGLHVQSHTSEESTLVPMTLNPVDRYRLVRYGGFSMSLNVVDSERTVRGVSQVYWLPTSSEPMASVAEGGAGLYTTKLGLSALDLHVCSASTLATSADTLQQLAHDVTRRAPTSDLSSSRRQQIVAGVLKAAFLAHVHEASAASLAFKGRDADADKARERSRVYSTLYQYDRLRPSNNLRVSLVFEGAYQPTGRSPSSPLPMDAAASAPLSPSAADDSPLPVAPAQYQSDTTEIRRRKSERFVDWHDSQRAIDNTFVANYYESAPPDGASANARTDSSLSTMGGMESHDVQTLQTIVEVARACAPACDSDALSKGVGYGVPRDLQVAETLRVAFDDAIALIRRKRVVQQRAQTLRTAIEVAARNDAARSAAASGPSSTPHGGAVDAIERRRREAVWKDALRELSVSGDPLFTFLKTLAGIIHEDVTSIIKLEDRSMEAAQRQREEQRRMALRSSMEFNRRIVDSLLSSILKDSGLRIDVSDSAIAQGRTMASQLVVVGSDSIDRVRRLASETNNASFFEAQSQLAAFLQERQGKPMQLSVLVDSMRAIVQQQLNDSLQMIDRFDVNDQRGAIDFLSQPRNSLVIRMKNETFAAIRQAYDALCVEMKAQRKALAIPSAYECIEGSSRPLCDQFAALSAYFLSQSRLFSSSSSVYVSTSASAANAQMLRIALQKTVYRAIEAQFGFMRG